MLRTTCGGCNNNQESLACQEDSETAKVIKVPLCNFSMQSTSIASFRQRSWWQTVNGVGDAELSTGTVVNVDFGQCSGIVRIGIEQIQGNALISKRSCLENLALLKIRTPGHDSDRSNFELALSHRLNAISLYCIRFDWGFLIYHLIWKRLGDIPSFYLTTPTHDRRLFVPLN